MSAMVTNAGMACNKYVGSYIYLHMNIHICIYICLYIYMYVCIYMNMYMYIYVKIWVCICINKYTYIHLWDSIWDIWRTAPEQWSQRGGLACLLWIYIHVIEFGSELTFLNLVLQSFLPCHTCSTEYDSFNWIRGSFNREQGSLD